MRTKFHLPSTSLRSEEVPKQYVVVMETMHYYPCVPSFISMCVTVSKFEEFCVLGYLQVCSRHGNM